MTTPTRSAGLPDDGYVLARTSAEYQRLRAQARLWEQVTAQALDRLGIGAGMRCLDVGCRPGEVMRLTGIHDRGIGQGSGGKQAAWMAAAPGSFTRLPRPRDSPRAVSAASMRSQSV